MGEVTLHLPCDIDPMSQLFCNHSLPPKQALHNSCIPLPQISSGMELLALALPAHSFPTLFLHALLLEKQERETVNSTASTFQASKRDRMFLPV